MGLREDLQHYWPDKADELWKILTQDKGEPQMYNNYLGIPAIYADKYLKHIYEFQYNDYQRKLLACNYLLNECGVECVEDRDKQWDKEVVMEYVNTGESYGVTILYDVEEMGFMVGCWGDWFENYETEKKHAEEC